MQELRLVIRGAVQGVYLRRTIQEWARELMVCGFAQNRPDGSVLVCAQGERPALETMRTRCYIGNERARIDTVQAEWRTAGTRYSSFEIL